MRRILQLKMSYSLMTNGNSSTVWLTNGMLPSGATQCGKIIKIYTNKEIGMARGIRSEYLKFWTQRVKQLC